MKMKVELEKRRLHKNVFDGSEEFIGYLWKGPVMDIDELQVNYS